MGAMLEPPGRGICCVGANAYDLAFTHLSLDAKMTLPRGCLAVLFCGVRVAFCCDIPHVAYVRISVRNG